MLIRLRSEVLLIPLLAVLSMAWAQTPAPVPPTESVQDLISRLTSEQKRQFDAGTQAFNAQRYPDALNPI